MVATARTSFLLGCVLSLAGLAAAAASPPPPPLAPSGGGESSGGQFGHPSHQVAGASPSLAKRGDPAPEVVRLSYTARSPQTPDDRMRLRQKCPSCGELNLGYPIAAPDDMTPSLECQQKCHSCGQQVRFVQVYRDGVRPDHIDEDMMNLPAQSDRGGHLFRLHVSRSSSISSISMGCPECSKSFDVRPQPAPTSQAASLGWHTYCPSCNQAFQFLQIYDDGMSMLGYKQDYAPPNPSRVVAGTSGSSDPVSILYLSMSPSTTVRHYQALCVKCKARMNVPINPARGKESWTERCTVCDAASYISQDFNPRMGTTEIRERVARIRASS